MEGHQKGANSRVSVDVSQGSEPANEIGNELVSLHRHQFSRPHRGETEKLIVRPWVNKLLLLGSLGLIAAVIAGCVIPTFSLEVLGIIGVAVETGQNFEDAATEHSVFSVIHLLFEEADFLGTTGDYFGLGTLSVLFVFTVLLVPIMQALVLLRQWFRPSTREEMQKMSTIIEILQAWQYAEVYLIAIFVGSWQLGPVSEFMINSYCDSLKETFGQLVYFGLLKEEDAQCFSVRSSITTGSFLLAIGAVLLALLTSFVTKAVVQYMRDQHEAENKLRDEEDSLTGSDYMSRADEDGERLGVSARIHPVPVLFTDTFRWLLYQENNRWGLPDAHYHWGAVATASNPNRAMFLPEAQVLLEETPEEPSEYPKMKSSEPASAIKAKAAPSSGSSVGSFTGFKAKGLPTAGLKTTGLPPRESFEQLSSNDNYNDETNSFTNESVFRDEVSLPPSAPGAAPSRDTNTTNTTADYDTTVTDTAESEFDYETVEDDVMSEYEEHTVVSEYEEQTVHTGYMTEIQEELEDVISSYDQGTIASTSQID